MSKAGATITQLPKQNFPLIRHSSTGGDQQCRKIEYKPVYFGTFVVTREDVQKYMAHHPQYTKANRFKDIVLKVYI
ncbi:hypothetical protein D3Z62_14950 [Lachnospiraceae bacterium]|nr:hypothetical protein [Lachnospiraceae bacterium]